MNNTLLNFTTLCLTLLHHGWRKFWILTWNGLRLTQFYYFYLSLLQHGWEIFWNLTFWNAPDSLDISIFYLTLLHHGWRKFWNLTFWNASDWLNFTISEQLIKKLVKNRVFYKKYPKTGGKQENRAVPPKTGKSGKTGQVGTTFSLVAWVCRTISWIKRPNDWFYYY